MNFVDHFRASAPYIHAYRGKCCVVWLNLDPTGDDRLASIVSDLALLSSLGLKLVILFQGAPTSAHQALDKSQLNKLIQGVGQQEQRIKALFSQGIVNSPMHGSAIRVVSGNYLLARPAGVVDGLDLQCQGRVRRIDHLGIQTQLEHQNLVLIPPLGYSITGDALYLAPELAVVELAQALKADKVIVVGADPLPLTKHQQELDLSELRAVLAVNEREAAGYLELATALKVASSGITRCHLIASHLDGALLSELFTRDGVGTLIALDHYDTFRQAKNQDLQGILALLKPLEDEQILVRREADQIAAEITRFMVNERDGMMIGCAALHPLTAKQAELACVAVHPDYQQKGRGNALLKTVEKQAKQQGFEELIALTTQTEHWFVARGFEQISLDELPDNRQALYNHQRNSKIYKKRL